MTKRSGAAALLMALFLAVLWPWTATADSGKLDQLKSGAATLRVGTDATFPPFESTTSSGQMTGFDIDMVRELARRAGIKNVQFVQMPFANIVPAIQAGQIDMGASSIYITDARAKVVDFSDVYYPGGLGIFVSTKNTSINSLADLAGKKVALQVGTKSVEWLKTNQPKAQEVTVENNEQMFNSIHLNQADAVITGIPAGKYFISQQGGVKQVGPRLTNENYGFAFSKQDGPVRVAFNTALKSMQSDGSYSAMTAKYFADAATPTTATTHHHHILDPSTIADSWREIGRGLLVSLEVIAGGLVLSIALGTLGGLARLSTIGPLQWLGSAYVSIIRGTPFVVQLFFIYFALPELGLQLAPMVAGIIALGLYSGSYVTEIFRGAVQSIDRGQVEAARSCGMSASATMRHVVLPQAVVRMLPALGNEFVSLVKESSLVSFITIHELFLVAQTIISRTFDAFTVYLTVALLYYLLTSIISIASSRLEKRMSRFI